MSDPSPGFRQLAFGDTADPHTFYPSAVHERVHAEILAAARTLTGLVVLTGAPGTGKTTILRRVARDVEAAGGRVCWCSVAELLDAPVAALAGQLGASHASALEARLATLRAQARAGSAIVVAVDEAQRLRHGELEELRKLAEVGTTVEKRVTVLLAGQPELNLKLATLAGQRGTPAYGLHVVLASLPAAEVGPYVAYRLGLVEGRRDDVFQPEAIERVVTYAEGIPRVINQLCDAALRTAQELGGAPVSAPLVDSAARSLALATVRSLRSRHRTPPTRARRAESRRASVGLWWAGASVAILILVAAVLFTSRWTSPPFPPPLEPAIPTQAEAPLDRPATSDSDALTARVAPAPPSEAPERVIEPPSASRRGPRLEGAPGVDARGGTSSPMTSRTPVPSVAPGAPLMAPALLSNSEVGNLVEVNALLAAGISPDVRDSAGMTPLMLAVIHDHGAVAELLLARRADVNASDSGGVTALMLAATHGRTALLERLVDRRANINARTRAGWTPLTYAAWNGRARVVQRLLAAGADPALTDRIGWTALQYATWRATDIFRTKGSDAANPLALADPEPAEAAYRRYLDVVRLLAGPTESAGPSEGGASSGN